MIPSVSPAKLNRENNSTKKKTRRRNPNPNPNSLYRGGSFLRLHGSHGRAETLGPSPPSPYARASLPSSSYSAAAVAVAVGTADLAVMDFAELEATEGLRWPWNSWPTSRPDAAALVVPLSVMCTPLMPIADLPLLPYDPLMCAGCRAALNPYSRVDYRSALWACPFCHQKNPFPRSYAGIGENNLPAELFPTYSAVEYVLSRNPISHSGFGLTPSSTASLLSSSVSSLASSLSSTSSLPGPEPSRPLGPSFVFVVDVFSSPEELRALKNEILHVVAQLPENALVGLVSFGSMVWVHDLGFTDCSRAVLFCGDRELTSEKVKIFTHSLF